MGFYDDVLSKIEAYISERGQAQRLASKAGINANLISRWANKQRKPSLENIGKVMDAIGAKVIFDDASEKTIRPVQISCAQHLSKDELASANESHVAIPVIDRPIADDKSSALESQASHYMLFRPKQELEGKSKLIALEIGSLHEGESMFPTLCPSDLVVIDQEDFIPQKPPGNIYLVRTPGKKLFVSRVSVCEHGGKQVVILYFDNPKYGPQVIDIDVEDGHSLRQIIKGRAIFGLNDMRKI